MRFPETGQYVVPGAPDLLEIDVERDHGGYAETNLWMRHAQRIGVSRSPPGAPVTIW
jgi:hypothetical protein